MHIIPIILIFLVFTYISIKDWQTGLISDLPNFIILALSIIYAFVVKANVIDILIKLAIFVLPFIILEIIYQGFFNKEKDEDKFMIGQGDIILFASMSIILSQIGMVVMLFFACLFSLIIAKVVSERKIPFAPFIQIGFVIAYLFADKIYMILFSLTHTL